jgi:hypothetical protein
MAVVDRPLEIRHRRGKILRYIRAAILKEKAVRKLCIGAPFIRPDADRLRRLFTHSEVRKLRPDAMIGDCRQTVEVHE